MGMSWVQEGRCQGRPQTPRSRGQAQTPSRRAAAQGEAGEGWQLPRPWLSLGVGGLTRGPHSHAQPPHEFWALSAPSVLRLPAFPLAGLGMHRSAQPQLLAPKEAITEKAAEFSVISLTSALCLYRC